MKIIIKYLNTWRNDEFLGPLENTTYRRLPDLQDNIGAQQFFKGWLHQEWEAIQGQYYSEIKSRRSNKRWTIALITKLWDVAWDLWDYRNAVYHQQQNISQCEDTDAMNLKVRDLYHNLAQTGLLAKDRHLLSISLSRLLLFPCVQKVEWLHQVNLAIEIWRFFC